MSKRVATYFMGLLLSLALSIGAWAQQDTHTFSQLTMQAEAAYYAGDFDTAITLYEQILANSDDNAAIYFNLGNAYYESDQLGFALLNYRRAEQIDPRMDGLMQNIVRIRAKRIDFQRDERNLIHRIAASTQGTLTLTELGWIAASVWTFWFVLVTLWLLLARWRYQMRWFVAGIGIVMVIVVGAYSARSYADANQPRAVVIGNATQVMSGPGENYLSIGQLFSAAEMRLLDTDGVWVRFVLPDGSQGWLRSDTIERV